MDKLQWVIRKMKEALEMSWLETGNPTVPNDVAARARSMGVDPVRAERAARLSLAFDVQ
jgi:hypothetical protein